MQSEVHNARPGLEQLYESEWEPLMALAYTLTGSRAASEDIVQDAFVRAQKNWSQVSHYERPGAWLRRVVLNLAVSRWRRTLTEARALLRLSTDTTAIDVSDDTIDCLSAIRRLPKRQGQVVALYYIEDRSVGDIAQILGCAEGTVRAHLHQARASLARELG